MNGSSADVWCAEAISELRHRAFRSKLQMRAQHAAALTLAPGANGPLPLSSGSWIPLGPMPLASDASGNGTQDYHQVSGRATAVAIDPADATGNTVYIAGAQSGVWKSTNGADSTPDNVSWTPITDDQATLSIGALAIQPGNNDSAKTVILAATGEANNSGDSYFGLGILRSADAGTTWKLIPTANNGGLSFAGLGGTRMAFSTAIGQMNVVVSAMATSSEGLIDGLVTPYTKRGLYTSLDAGGTWTYNSWSILGESRMPPPRLPLSTTREPSASSQQFAPRLLLFTRRCSLDASQRATRWRLAQYYRMPAAIDLEQSRMSTLPRRNHRCPRTKRNVRLVRLP